MTVFAYEHKTAAPYLDVAANAHGQEKASLMHQALTRVTGESPHLVEVGPGGGAAVRCLASRLAAEAGRRRVRLTLLEAPGVRSSALNEAMAVFNRVGDCELVNGLAQDLTDLIGEPAQVISASALLHEVYSYGGGYPGIMAMLRSLPSALAPGGMFAYRDVYAVDGGSLHRRAVHVFQSQAWLRFLRLFTTRYLGEGTHPYHRMADEVVFRQDSRIVAAGSLDDSRCAVVSAPVGFFREVQRHYVTLRDHVWRSGVLGFRPYLDGRLAADWIDTRSGHKRVHVEFTDVETATVLRSLSEPFSGHCTVDGDMFDDITDIALSSFLDRAERRQEPQVQVWEAWAAREGRETYAYLSLEELLATCATASVEAGTGTVLLPLRGSDVSTRERAYYDRYLRRTLANPLRDAKQLVLFTSVAVEDTRSMRQALRVLRRWCGRTSLAEVYATLSERGWRGC